jgi:hypothetical protein
MKKLLLTGFLALSILGVTPADAQTPSGKEEYMLVTAVWSSGLATELNKYAQQSWKVRAFSTLPLKKGDAGVYFILFREIQ